VKKNLRVIVAGAGRVGRRTAQLLDERGHDVVIVEKDGSRCEKLSGDYAATIIHGDAADAEILRQAGPEKAQALAALTPESEVNGRICRLAHDLNSGLRLVARAGEEDHGDLRGVADEVVYPEDLGAVGAANALLGSSVRALETVAGRLRVLEVKIGEDAPVAGRTLEEVSLPEGVFFVSGADAGRLARRDTVLDAGRTYIVAAEPEVVEELQQLLRG